MFDAYCQDHGHTVLLGHRNVKRVHNTESGIEVHLTCHCGAHLVLETGRPPRRLVAA